MATEKLNRLLRRVFRLVIHKRHRAYLVGLAGLALVATGLLIIRLNNSKTTGPVGVPVASEVVTSDTTEPSESKPTDSDNAAYTVGENEPRTISIPDLVINGLVQKVGLTKTQAIAVPTNIHFAGWYVGSVAPGEIGLSIIDGHVSGSRFDAIFKNLGKAKIGQVIVIEFGDKSIKKFSVTNIKIVPEGQAAKELFSRDGSIDHQLNLITCTGKFNNKTQTYDDRVIVEAKFIE